MKPPGAQLLRAAARTGRSVSLSFEGGPVTATEGDSVLAALLTHGAHVRRNEFAGDARAGFCLMGACQDCWVWSADAGWIRACTTPVSDGLSLFATAQGNAP